VAVLNNLAIVSSELNKNKQAIEYLDQALYLFPHYEESLSNKVIVYYRDKQYKNAYIALLHQSTRKPNKQYKDFKAGLERLINKEKGR
jgi:Tfp pilus assembly protein PilF